MTNKTLSPQLHCYSCFYEDLLPTEHPCRECARNNLSGYYEDMYVDIVEIYNELYEEDK